MPITHEYTERIARSPRSVPREMNIIRWASGPDLLIRRRAQRPSSRAGDFKTPQHFQQPRNSFEKNWCGSPLAAMVACHVGRLFVRDSKVNLSNPSRPRSGAATADSPKSHRLQSDRSISIGQPREIGGRCFKIGRLHWLRSRVVRLGPAPVGIRCRRVASRRRWGEN